MSESFVGDWEGRWAVRRGREDELTGAERKRFIVSGEIIALCLRGDGSFCHKRSIQGTWRQSANLLKFAPTHVDGHSRKDMEQAALQQGRAFRLDFLFEEFALEIDGESLATPDDRRLLYVRYTRLS